MLLLKEPTEDASTSSWQTVAAINLPVRETKKTQIASNSFLGYTFSALSKSTYVADRLTEIISISDIAIA